MRTFKITLAYDGTSFVGWQRQATGTSIQGLLEDALRALDGREVIVTGSGRTDAGVHALGQAASFSLERTIAPAALVRALNARLPGDVRVWSAEEVAPDFHARFGARRKTYRYRIWNADLISPFERRYAWHVTGALDVEQMMAAASLVEGRHDFAAFQAAGGNSGSTDRTITLSRITCSKPCTVGDTEDERGGPLSAGEDPTGLSLRVPRVPCGGELRNPLISYQITGDGFLRHMVRNLVGSLVEIGRGRQAVAWVHDVMASGDRTRAGPTAPPEGLFLVRVDYDAGALSPEPSSTVLYNPGL